MAPEIQGYSDFIDMLLEKADSHAASLSTDALNWQPLDADTNSVAALCAHMCGVVRWWVQQGLTGNDVGRQRDTEFVAQRRRQRQPQLLGHPTPHLRRNLRDPRHL